LIEGATKLVKWENELENGTTENFEAGVKELLG